MPSVAILSPIFDMLSDAIGNKAAMRVPLHALVLQAAASVPWRPNKFKGRAIAGISAVQDDITAAPAGTAQSVALH